MTQSTVSHELPAEMHRRSSSLLFVILVLGLTLSGCASYQTKVEKARNSMRTEQPEAAVKILEPLAKEEGKDQLVYILDYAVALQTAGNFKESEKIFEKAETIADIQDYTSLSKEASSLLLSEEMVQYKGDNFEKVMINGMNVINYLMQDNLDEALVEVRRLNQKLYKFKFEAKKDYEQNPYAYYLSGVIWEAGKKWDDAYIDYKKAYDLIPNYEPLHEDLLRAAIRAQRSDDVEQWKKKYPSVKIKPEWKDQNLGEIIFIYQQGWGPRKYPRPESPRFPKLYPVSSATQMADLEVDGQAVARTQMLFSVQDIAIKTLDDDYAALVAKRVGGIVAKAVVSDQIRQKNRLLGDLTWIAMNVADRADLRQWSTLPQSLQIARVSLKPGKYKVGVAGLNISGYRSGEDMPAREIEVLPGKKTFVTWRSFK